MTFIDDLWQHCQQQAPKLERFSLNLFDQSDFDFFLSPRWPVEKIKKALAINMRDTNQPGAWKIYGLSTENFDYHPHVDRFARDQVGKMDVKSNGELYAFYDPVNQFFRAYDFTNKRAAFIYDAGHVFTEWEIHSPFKELWHFWALKNNAILIHSGIVSHNGLAVLLPGAGGAGKSTTVLSALSSGMKTTGDDYNLLLATGRGFVATPLYGNVKLKNARPGSVRFDFPLLKGWGSEALAYAAKTIYYPPESTIIWDKSRPLLAGIVTPDIAGNETPEIADMKLTELINHLAMSSIMQSPFMAKEYLARCVQMTKSIRHGRLHLSPSPEKNAVVLREWMAA